MPGIIARILLWTALACGVRSLRFLAAASNCSTTFPISLSFQFAKVMDTLGSGRHGQQILAAWIGKEKLRDALNLRARITRSAPCERDVRGRLFSCYDWCARNDDISELLTLARRVRTACTRGRSRAHARTKRRSRLVTGRPP